MTSQPTETTTNERAQILAVALAAAVAIVVGEGPFSLWSTVTGSMLLLFLLSYPIPREHGKTTEHYAIGAVFGLCFLLMIGFLLNYIPEDTNLVLRGRELETVSRLPGSNQVDYEFYREEYDPLNLRDGVGFLIWAGCTVAVGEWRRRSGPVYTTGVVGWKRV
jgi:hypothetical protein